MTRRTALRVTIIGIVVILAVLLYLLVDPSTGKFFPKCPFHMLTGLKCAGCGSQRAIHQLLNLHIGEAFSYNAALVLSIPLVAFLIGADLFQKKWPRLALWARNPALAWTVFALIMFWWIFRNVFGW